MEIVTRSGQHYYYDRNTNRISLEERDRSDYYPLSFRSVEVNTESVMCHFCIEMTRQCNFRCKYCCYSGEYNGWRSHSKQCQTDENLKKILDFVDQYVTKDELFSVSFYGGEALLEFAKIQKIVEQLQDKYADRVRFSLSTNGYLLSEEVIDYICSIPHFEINVTIDGDEEMHDANRVRIDGQGTYRLIMRNLANFKQRHPKEYGERVGFLATLSSTTELPALNEAWMQNTLLSDHLPKHVSTISPNFSKEVKGTSFEEKRDVFYLALDHYKQGINDVLTSQLEEITNLARNREIYDLPKDLLTVKTCLTELEHCFIDCDGNLAPCERVCDSFRIGSLGNGIDLLRMKSINDQFISFQNSHCKDCWAQRLCAICPKHMEHSESEMEYICQKEKDFAKLSLLMFCEMVEVSS